MKSKKILALLLMAVMICGSLIGCGNKTSNNSGDSSSSTTPTAAPTSAATDTSSSGQTVNITIWNNLPTDPSMNMFDQCEQATGIKVNATVIPETDYSSKLNQMVATGDSSNDIYIVWENDLGNFAKAGGIIPLDNYLSTSTINTSDFIGAVSTLSSGLGATYGLPWCAATEVLYYNKDMFDAASIPYPTNNWSYQDYLSAAQKLTQKAADGTTTVYGSALPNTQTWWAGIAGTGDQVFDPSTGKMVIGNGAVSFVTDCANMVKNGEMPAPSSDTTDLFAAGKVAMAWEGSWMIGSYGNTLPFKWDIASLPVNQVKYDTLHTGFYTINSKSKNQDAAFKVIQYLMGEQGQTINSKASGNLSAIKSIAAEGAWKVSGTPITNWDAMTDSLASGIFGYTCLPSGVTNNAVSEFNNALLGQKTPQEAVDAANAYAQDAMSN